MLSTSTMIGVFSHSALSLARIQLGPVMTNVYVLESPNKFLVVDPAAKSQVLLDHIKAKPFDIFLTHCHYDHIDGVEFLCNASETAKIYLSKDDEPLALDPKLNGSVMRNKDIHLRNLVSRFVFLKDGDNLEIDNEKYSVISVPGHTPGGLSLYHPSSNSLFCGDSLFKGSIGRTDFPGGDFATLIKNLKEKLLVLPPETVAYPGHMEPTTIGEEVAHNPFLQAEDL